VFGISVDSPYTHAAWRERLGLPAELVLLSDFNREFGRAFDLLQTPHVNLRNVLRRRLLVIDQEGTVVHLWEQSDPASLPTPDEALDALRWIQRERLEQPRAQPDVMAEEIGDEIVLFHPGHNRGYVLNPTAAFVWSCCDGTNSVEAIVNDLASVYGQPEPVVRGDVCEVLSAFHNAGLLASV